MAYEKQTWTDELLAPDTLLNDRPAYRITDESGKVITSKANIELVSTVAAEGTRVTAERLGHMENGIANAGSELNPTAIISAVINALHPVGSVVMTHNNVNPGTTMPGTTWVNYAAGRVITGVGSNEQNTYNEDSTGGKDLIKLMERQLPEHSHEVGSHTHSIPSHTHTQDSHTHTQTSHDHGAYPHTHSIPSHTHTQATHDHLVQYTPAGKLLSLNSGGTNYRLTWNTDGSAGNDVKTVTATPTINGSGALTSNSTSIVTTGIAPTIQSATPPINAAAAATSGNASSGYTAKVGADYEIDIRQAYQTAYYWRRTA